MSGFFFSTNDVLVKFPILIFKYLYICELTFFKSTKVSRNGKYIGLSVIFAS